MSGDVNIYKRSGPTLDTIDGAPMAPAYTHPPNNYMLKNDLILRVDRCREMNLCLNANGFFVDEHGEYQFKC